MSELITKILADERKKLIEDCRACKEYSGFSPECKKECEETYHKCVRCAWAGIPKNFWFKTLGDYQTEDADKENAKIKREVHKTVREYCDNLDRAKNQGLGILFHGRWGVGKSLLASCILKKALLKGYTVKMRYLPEIIEALKPNGDREGIKKEFEEKDFYCIDDFGHGYSKSGSDFVPKEFDTLFMSRVKWSKPTLITTNFEPKEIKEFYGEHLFSVFSSCMKPLWVPGDDHRKKMREIWDTRLTGDPK
jgi:DNA replication protein DnaC